MRNALRFTRVQSMDQMCLHTGMPARPSKSHPHSPVETAHAHRFLVLSVKTMHSGNYHRTIASWSNDIFDSFHSHLTIKAYYYYHLMRVSLCPISFRLYLIVNIFSIYRIREFESQKMHQNLLFSYFPNFNEHHFSFSLYLAVLFRFYCVITVA